MREFYRLLLRLYPSGFRRQYGDEMAAIFADRVAVASGVGRAALMLGAIVDVVRNALALHAEILGQDLRYTWRTLRRAPGFALTAIFVTALGVGANTAAFSVADFVLIRPLPFPDPESLVRLCQGPRDGSGGWGCNNELSPANYRDFKGQTTSFASLGAYRNDAVNLVGGGEPERLQMAAVDSEVLSLLGIRPALGRVFSQRADEADASSVVLGHRLWETRFGSDPDILGRVVNLDGSPHVVIGVMPESFHFPTRDAQLWTPLDLAAGDFENRNNNYLNAVGRLADGVSFEQAHADLEVVVERLARAYPETNEETGVSFFRMRDGFSPRIRLILQALCGASLCILLLACANLGNLLLARAGERERELAVRAALGAGKERLVRQMVTESIVLAAVGGAAGVVVAFLAFPLLSLLIPVTLPIGATPSLNLRLLALASIFTAVVGLGFGVLPALRSGGASTFGTLRSRGWGDGKLRYRSALVAIQVAASVVLLASSGLLIRAILRVQSVDPGFETEGVLALRTVLPKPKYESGDRREQFYRDVLTGIRGLPGVQAAAYTTGLPMVMTGGITRVTLPGQELRPDGDYMVSRRYVTPQFFDALRIPLLRGRDLEDGDGDRANVAVVSASFAQRYWPGEDPIGRSFLFQDEPRTVVGVVGDIMVRGLERSSEPQMYVPSSDVGDGPLSFYDPKDLVIRTTGSVDELLPAVREIVRSVDPDQPISDVMTLSDLLGLQVAPRRAQVQLLAALAAVALLLAGLGINGLLAYTVGQRRQEIGLRLALGAEPGRIARRIVSEGVSIVAIGLIPGLIVAFIAGRAMSTLLFGVQPADPTTILVTVGLCLSMAITGALLPARRALRVSPMSVMRSE